LDDEDNCIAEAELVVLAAGFDSTGLTTTLANLPLQAVRGQVASGAVTDASAMPPFPVNGHGSFIPTYTADDGKPRWLMGATFERDNPHADIKDEDRQEIFGRLQQLLPHTAEVLKASFDESQAWAGVRAVSPDRLPIVGPLDDVALPGVCVCTALGSRGLSFAVLCGELLAAWLHAEPLPLDKRLAQSLLASRYRVSE
jgi:tRNA 5-methylaminomethyl-2-thiouridine biosynthesis bifunctional protein